MPAERDYCVNEDHEKKIGLSNKRWEVLQELAVRSYRAYREVELGCVRVQYEKISFYAVTRFFLQTAGSGIFARVE